GPGTVLPNVQPSYFTPGAISIVRCVIGIRNSRTRASVASCTVASNAGVVAVTLSPKSIRSTCGSPGRTANPTVIAPSVAAVAMLPTNRLFNMMSPDFSGPFDFAPQGRKSRRPDPSGDGGFS